MIRHPVFQSLRWIEYRKQTSRRKAALEKQEEKREQYYGSAVSPSAA
jgi:hypothetical protein